ncbi:hypothetical protein K502DRAFT_324126 [Neoconidiobolus thromboides FSU 785]|nr:hypothetical protein K502DRAFT_324126 [Neoconidiobolus thromboides FSU 785]
MGELEKKKISVEEWKQLINQVDVSKNDLNRLIMDYLVIEGYRDAAESFSQEASIASELDFGSIDERMRIRNAIQAGNVDEAIERTNDINPEILDTNPDLFFHLQLQKFIEMIKERKDKQALEFSQNELAARGEENQHLLKKLERAMTLLCFKTEDNPHIELLDYSQRLKMASELNGAILAAQALNKEPKLPTLLKLTSWAQNRLSNEIVFPIIKDLTGATLSSPISDTASSLDDHSID